MIHRKLLFLVLLFFPASLVWAAHITDKLVVGLYNAPKAEGTPLRLLSSGTPIEVLRRKDGFAEVRMADETVGWVEVRYVTDEKPAKAMLLETQARLRQMGMELAALRERTGENSDVGNQVQQAAAPSLREAALQQALTQAEARIAELEASSADAPEELLRLRDSVREALIVLAESQDMVVRAKADSEQQDWLTRHQSWIVGLFALSLGFGAGIVFIDRRIRKRYGGFRI